MKAHPYPRAQTVLGVYYRLVFKAWANVLEKLTGKMNCKRLVLQSLTLLSTKPVRGVEQFNNQNVGVLKPNLYSYNGKQNPELNVVTDLKSLIPENIRKSLPAAWFS